MVALKQFHGHIRESSAEGMHVCRSAVDPMVHQNTGLIGGLLVTRADAVAADGRANDTDIEFFILFHVFHFCLAQNWLELAPVHPSPHFTTSPSAELED